MERANEAHVKIEAHEELCAERYANIHNLIAGVQRTSSTVLKLLAWGGSTVFMLLVGLLGFLASRAINSNDARVNQLQNQLEQVQHAKPEQAVMHMPKKSPLS